MYLTQPEWAHLHARWIQREVGFDYAHVSWNFLDFIESSCRKWHQTSNREQSSRKSDATRGLPQSAVVKSDHRRGRDQLSRQFAAARLRGIERGLARMHLCENLHIRLIAKKIWRCAREILTTCTLISIYIYLSIYLSFFLSFFYIHAFVKYSFGSFSEIKFNTKECRSSAREFVKYSIV